MSWLFRRPDEPPFHDKAWKRSDMAAWDERWSRLSVPARRRYLDHVKAAAYRQSAGRPFNKSGSFEPSILQEWRQAGLIRDENKPRSEGFVVTDEAIGFTARLRALRRYHLLDSDSASEFDNYISYCFATFTLAQVIDKIVEQQTGLARHTLGGDPFNLFVKRRRWPDWVASYLNDPLAAPLLAAVEAGGGSLPLPRLLESLPGRAAAEARAAVDKLVNHLALVEDLDPTTFDIRVGLLPAVLQDRRRAAQGGHAPPLQAVRPVEAMPEGGLVVPDLRAVLLEVAGGAPRLKQNQSLFQKETDRFLACLEPLPRWLDAANPERRLTAALHLARQARLAHPVRGHGGALELDLTPEGRRWLGQSPEEQYAELFRLFRTPDQRAQWPTADDAFFLGGHVSALRVKGGPSRRRDAWHYQPLTDEERQPLRDAVYRVFAELPEGEFFLEEDFLARAATGSGNPLLLGGDAGGVTVRQDSRLVPPLEEHLEDAARKLLHGLLHARLVPLGCVQLGHDARGRPLMARRPRLAVYFGKVDVAPEAPAAEQTRVVVQPDFSVIVIGLNPAPVADLAPFCERVRGRASQGSLTFRLSRESVLRGLAAGLPPEEALARLRKHASTPIPANVATEVAGWCSWARTVAQAPATLLRCPDREAADRVMGALGKAAERIGDTFVAVALDSLNAAARQKLQGQGILLANEQGGRRKRG
jgi:hypothetical protein